MNKRQDEFERSAMPHSRSLLRFACRLTNDRSEAEDLVQETLLAAWRGFHRFQTGTNARAWLFRILINNFHGRDRKPRLALVTPSHSSGIRAGACEALEITQALEQLPAQHRAVLMLGVVEGFTCREIAEILSVPIGTVMSRLSRARQSLREKLAPALTHQGNK